MPKRFLIAAILIPWLLLGCGEPQPLIVQTLYQPNRYLFLTYTTEVQIGLDKDNCSLERGEFDAVATTAEVADPNYVLVGIYFTRLAGGDTYRGQEKDIFSTDKPPPRDAPGWEEYRRAKRYMDAAYFRAELDSKGRVLSFDANEPIDAARPDRIWKGMPEQEKAFAGGVQSGGVFSALADSLAYLPPPNPQPGEQWGVVREAVYPFAAAAFHKMTGGAWRCRERSICTVRGIKWDIDGWMVTIDIQGVRTPVYPDGRNGRIKSFEVRGELRFSLDRNTIASLRLESVPDWADEKDRKEFSGTIVDSLKTRLQW